MGITAANRAAEAPGGIVLDVGELASTMILTLLLSRSRTRERAAPSCISMYAVRSFLRCDSCSFMADRITGLQQNWPTSLTRRRCEHEGEISGVSVLPQDWLSDINVVAMSAEEESAYIRLICYCWLQGSIPNNDEYLAKLIKGGSTTVVGVVKRCFHPHPNDETLLVHPRREREREKQRMEPKVGCRWPRIPESTERSPKGEGWFNHPSKGGSPNA